MSGEQDIWRLYADDEHLADLVVTGGDFPWLDARIECRPGFDRFRRLFDQEWQATEAEDWDTADRPHRDIREAVRLTYPDGRDVPEFLLHVQGDEAWWRWSDEAFEELN